jgi:hypothetical protein
MVARFPESDAIIPERIFTSRANQLAEEPESQVRMARSGTRGESSQNTRWGLIGSASSIARASSTFHQSRMFSSISSRQPRSSFRRSSGMSSCSVSRLWPQRFTSIG